MNPWKMRFEFRGVLWLNPLMKLSLVLFFALTGVILAAEPRSPAPEQAAPVSEPATAPVDESSKPVGGPTREFQYGRDERIKNEDGTETVIWRETDEQRAMPYDPYKRFQGDSAKSPKTRWREIDRAFPEERKKEAEEKARRAARPQEEKDREKELLDKQPVLQEKINPTIKERGSIPKRF
ncbi:hypothetical protein QQ056_19615 [Oscillatoria laete-virens NRMC-F 0139]|nr:hypothetical protein [Oscillatoria laete-virens]MDL5055739.1 hypothetical protein [Oscillatoria laete-virens NRMC-F 0139]